MRGKRGGGEGREQRAESGRCDSRLSRKSRRDEGRKEALHLFKVQFLILLFYF